MRAKHSLVLLHGLLIVYALWAAGAAQGQEPAGVVYDVATTVYPVGETKVNVEAPVCSLGDAPDMGADLLCQPDPSDEICKGMSVQEKQKQADHAKKVMEAVSDATPLWSHVLAPSDQQSVVEKRVLAMPLFKGRTKIEERIKALLASYERLLSSRTILKPASRAAISQVLASCLTKFNIDVVRMKEGLNAGAVPINALPSGQLTARTGEGVDPYVALASHECNIILTPRTWVECVQGSPLCDLTLAHELGHLFNSCGYAYNGLQLQETVARPPMYFDGDYGLLYGRRNEWLKNIGLGAKEMLELSQDLMSGTECLAVTSAPHDSEANACAKGDAIKTDLERRCGFNTLSRFPSQWNEAEADAWGASAYANYLKTIASVPERRRLVKEALAAGCQIAEIGRAAKKKAEGRVKVVPSDCRQNPRSGRKLDSDGWNVHQEWTHREDRNLLRNVDLREALGCKVDKNVPVACAPGRALYFVVPQ